MARVCRRADAPPRDLPQGDVANAQPRQGGCVRRVVRLRREATPRARDVRPRRATPQASPRAIRLAKLARGVSPATAAPSSNADYAQRRRVPRTADVARQYRRGAGAPRARHPCIRVLAQPHHRRGVQPLEGIPRGVRGTSREDASSSGAHFATCARRGVCSMDGYGGGGARDAGIAPARGEHASESVRDAHVRRVERGGGGDEGTVGNGEAGDGAVQVRRRVEAMARDDARGWGIPRAAQQGGQLFPQQGESRVLLHLARQRPRHRGRAVQGVRVHHAAQEQGAERGLGEVAKLH